MDSTVNALLGLAVLVFLVQGVQLIWTVILVREVRRMKRRAY